MEPHPAQDHPSDRSTDRPSDRRAVAWTFIGVLALLGSGGWALSIVAGIGTAVVVDATVIAVETRSSGIGDNTTQSTYRPTFRFTDPQGDTHTVTPRAATNWWNDAEGSTVELRYPAGQPDAARPTDFWTVWFWPIIVAGIGVFMALVGTRSYLAQQR